MRTPSLNPGRLGSKRQSWSQNNPRELIRDAVISRPRASEAEIRNVVWETIKNEKGYFETIFDYWFANNYRSFFIEELENEAILITPVKRTCARQSNQPSRPEIEKAKEEMRPILMDHMLSGGMLLREATFGECKKEGGWLKEVAKYGKPSEVVGKHLTEKDLWNLRKRIFDNK